MGRRGPQPDPIEVHRARGCSSQYTRRGEPDSLPGEPEMHPMIVGNAEAERMWGEMREMLGALRIWSRQYAAPLATYCLVWSRLVAYEAGELELTFPQWDKLLNQVLKYQREFGCTPASKTMLRVDKNTEPQAEDPKAKFGVAG